MLSVDLSKTSPIVLRRILWTVVILLGGAVAAERSADILIALSPYRSSGSLPRGMSPVAVPLLATAVEVAPSAADSQPVKPVFGEEPSEEPQFEEPAAYMARPLRVQVTTFDGPANEVARPLPDPIPDQSFAR